MAEFGDTNPNEYNEEKFLKADLQLVDAVLALWEAGASIEDIQASVNNAIANAE